MQHNGHAYWQLGAPDSQNRVVIVRSLQTLAELAAVLIVNRKLESNLLNTQWPKAVRTAHQSGSLPQFLVDRGELRLDLPLLRLLCDTIRATANNDTGAQETSSTPQSLSTQSSELKGP